MAYQAERPTLEKQIVSILTPPMAFARYILPFYIQLWKESQRKDMLLEHLLPIVLAPLLNILF